MTKSTKLTNATGAPVADNTNIRTAGPRGPASLEDVWRIEKLAHLDREVNATVAFESSLGLFIQHLGIADPGSGRQRSMPGACRSAG